MGFITTEGLKHLDSYKYCNGGFSILDKILNYFWEAVTKLLPRWLAPNLVTLIGFILMVLSYAIMIPYDHKLSQNIPSWTFYVAAFFQFMYQTLDAIDGKQARRTKSSSPLGQLFDHGCDSFTMTFLVLTAAEAAKFGSDKNTLFALVSTCYIIFWLSSWSEYHTKILKTQMYNLGVTEGQIAIIGALLFSAIFGQDAWLTPVKDMVPAPLISLLPNYSWINTILSIRIKYYVVYSAIAVGAVFGTATFISTIKAAKDKKEALLQNVPLLLLLGISYLWKGSILYSTKRSLVSLLFGLNFSLFTCRLIVCSMAEMKFPKFHRELVFLGGVTAILRRDLWYPKMHIFGSNVDTILLYASIIFTVLSSVQWCHQVIKEITTHLGIYCFSVKKRSEVKVE